MKQAAPTMEWKLLARLWPHARPDRRLFIASLLLTPLAMAGALLQPLLLKRAIDDHIVPQTLDGLIDIATLYLLLGIGTYIVQAAYTLCLSYAGQRTIVRLRESIFRHLLSLSPSFFDNRPAGALLTRVTSDVESLGEALTAGVVTILLDVLMVLGVLAIMFSIDWKLTLLLLAMAPPLLWTLSICRRKLRDLYLLIRETLGWVNAYIAESLGGIQILQLFHHEEASAAEFNRRNTIYKQATIRSNIFDALMYSIVDGGGRICIAIMLWYGSSSVLQGAVSAGMLVAFIDYLDRLFRPLQQFSGKVAVIQRATAALDKIYRLLDEGEVVPLEGLEPEKVAGHIVMRDLRFSYRDTGLPEDDVLCGVDLEVTPGSVLALVGHTGCGKTTLSRLLTRAYDGYRGSITLDGVEVRDIHPHVLRKHMAAVHQDVHILPESVRFNTDLGNPEINQAQIQEAAELVHAWQFIHEFPQQWEHKLGEGGGKLSGGEAQLLTFARTMAHDPTIIILDEATAAVDSVTESLVQDAVAQILKRKTVIVIAHRLSTVTAADKIVVLEQGRVVEVGNHQELVAQNGRYAHLVRQGLGQAAG